MASLYDLGGAPELVHWLKRLGPAPRGGLLTATPVAAASRFGILQVSGLAAGKGFYVAAIMADDAAGQVRFATSLTSGFITENLTPETNSVHAYGLGPSAVSAQTGRTAVTPSGGFMLRTVGTGTVVIMNPYTFMAPIYIPPGGTAALIIETAATAQPLSLAWLEVP